MPLLGLITGSETKTVGAKPDEPKGAATFTTSGSWTCPAGVTSICVVCVGGGAAGSRGSGAFNGTGTSGSGSNTGGAGGGLCWMNKYPVIPGTVYSVVVGSGGSPSSTVGTAGNQSYFESSSVIVANGGQAGYSAGSYTPEEQRFGPGWDEGPPGGTYSAPAAVTKGLEWGGGNGGSGGGGYYARAGGGGGAGGYTGGTSLSNNSRGGGIADIFAYSYTYTGSGLGPLSGGGGGGGGGAASTSLSAGAGGGGVGLLGIGTTGGNSGNIGVGGIGGSGGANGTNHSSTFGVVGGAGGLYGGGGGGAWQYNAVLGYSAAGAAGAVRIIWGPGLSFPAGYSGS